MITHINVTFKNGGAFITYAKHFPTKFDKSIEDYWNRVCESHVPKIKQAIAYSDNDVEGIYLDNSNSTV